MSLGHMLKKYLQKKVTYSKILSVSNDKRRLMLYLYIATYSKKTRMDKLSDNINGMV